MNPAQRGLLLDQHTQEGDSFLWVGISRMHLKKKGGDKNCFIRSKVVLFLCRMFTQLPII